MHTGQGAVRAPPSCTGRLIHTLGECVTWAFAPNNKATHAFLFGAVSFRGHWKSGC